ncbi:hypothetical protein [Nitrospira moscoviensis]|uniref:Uncharacterized protein n=1 Tax=Nitrospira moscoviensis TaxID=42253 RepID=A0A0K2GIJ2_NITMO|nr:hypothetical protein [Nitrospira moscoviensis]ALA60761.1 hypothetical protein NITMOv2_4386 [Nitrospira moscoviensis]
MNLAWNRFAAVPPVVGSLPKLDWFGFYHNPAQGARPDLSHIREAVLGK